MEIVKIKIPGKRSAENMLNMYNICKISF